MPPKDDEITIEHCRKIGEILSKIHNLDYSSLMLNTEINEDKFLAVINEYVKSNDISNVDWYSIIYGNLVGRFGWLDYNLKRSLGIKSDDSEEMKLAEQEVSKTLNEITRYLSLIDIMHDIFNKLIESKAIK